MKIIHSLHYFNYPNIILNIVITISCKRVISNTENKSVDFATSDNKNNARKKDLSFMFKKKITNIK
jgi:hypothetical protein